MKAVQARFAALNTGGRVVHAYDSDEIPPLPEMPYVVLNIERRQGFDAPSRRMTFDSDMRGWRVVCQVVGATADEARWMEEVVELALERYRLPVTEDVSVMRYDGGSPVARDTNVEDLYSGASTWTYVSVSQQAVA
jgi:hypothetical protein